MKMLRTSILPAVCYAGTWLGSNFGSSQSLAIAGQFVAHAGLIGLLADTALTTTTQALDKRLATCITDLTVARQAREREVATLETEVAMKARLVDHLLKTITDQGLQIQSLKREVATGIKRNLSLAERLEEASRTAKQTPTTVQAECPTVKRTVLADPNETWPGLLSWLWNGFVDSFDATTALFTLADLLLTEETDESW